MIKSLTYGVLPTKEEFEKAFNEKCPGGLFTFRNDLYVGNADLLCDELWENVKSASTFCGFTGKIEEEIADWCSCVLKVLGFEWI